MLQLRTLGEAAAASNPLAVLPLKAENLDADGASRELFKDSKLGVAVTRANRAYSGGGGRSFATGFGDGSRVEVTEGGFETSSASGSSR